MVQKLGPHCTRPTPGGKAWAAKANCVKALDSPEMLTYAPDHAIRIYRLYLPYQDQTAADLGGAGLADIIIASLGGYNHRNLYVEFPCNEWKQTITEIPYHLQILGEGVPILHAAGYRICAFNFSTGSPEPEVWQYLKAHNWGGLDLNKDAIGLHEYFSKNGFSQWHGLRHRLAHQWINGPHPPFIITETGIDNV